MSTVAPNHPLPPRPPLTPALLDSERYIDDQIHRTRRTLKLVDFTAGLITLLAALLAFLLVAAVIDHWLVPGGLSPLGRGVLFAGLLAIVGWIAWRHFLPLLRPINPVYAAHAIEQTSPSLKNSLLNLLLFRTRRRNMSAKVYHALEQQAALRLSTASLESAVDHSALLRLGYVLMLAVALCAAYAALSPKNLATSAGRVLAPWSSIAAPTRVQILDVKPGDASVAKGERLAISAEIHGVRQNETIRLRYSTKDESLVNETILMTRPGDGARFEAQLPRSGDAAASNGVQQDLVYWIEAGDAHTQRYNVAVFDRPTMVVNRVRYEFPAYTGMPSAEAASTGDVRGIEGTRVTIEGIANQPIKTAHVDFDADGKNDVPMTVDGEGRDRAVASFTLALRPDRRTPTHPSYVLRLVTAEGRSNADPAQYRIDVTPDYAPEVRVTKPEEVEVKVRADEVVPIGVEARDPDFAVQQVRLVGKVGNREIALGELLSKNHEGRFAAIKPVVPADSQLKAGDVLEYWAEARDNRRPEPNVAFSDRRRLRIIGGDAKGVPNQRPQQPGQPPQQPGENQQGEGNSGGGQQGGQQPGEGETGQQSGQAGQQQGAGGAGGGEGAQNNDSNQDNAQSSPGGGGGESNENSKNDGSAGQQRAGNQQHDANSKNKSGQSSGNGGDGQQQANPGNDQNNQTGGEQSGGAQAGDSGGGKPTRVSAEGDADADAFDRMREHFANEEAKNQSGQGTNQQGGENQPDSPGENQDSGNGQQQGQPKPGEQAQGRGNAAQERDGSKQSNLQEAGDPQSGARQQDGQQKNGVQQSGQADPNSGKQAGQGAAGRQQPGQSTDAQNKAGQQANDGQARSGEQQEQLANQKQNNANSGEPNDGERRGNAEQMPDKSAGEPNDGNQQSPSSPSGTNRNQGNAGSGHASNEDDGSPDMSQQGEPKQAADKTAKDNRKAEGDKEPAGRSPNKKESNSEGSQGGDRSGGGQQGGGQHADAPGKGDAGQHEASDQGAGKADQQGKGETGDKAGGQQQAAGKTGKSSENQPGAGSRSAASDKGATGEHGADQPSKQQDSAPPGEQSPTEREAGAERDGGASDQQNGDPSPSQNPGGRPSAKQQPGGGNESGQQSGGQPADGAKGEQPSDKGSQLPSDEARSPQDKPQDQSANQQSNSPPDQGAQQGGGAANSNPQGGGAHRNQSADIASQPEGPAKEDQANLEFARQQTDLVLNRLDEQLGKKQVDRNLLDRLGWNEEELRRFVDRWRGLKSRAESDKATKEELDAALRSLGLRPGGPQRFRAAAKEDKLRDLNEGYRSRAPLEYADRVRAYVKGAAASADEK